MKTSTVMFGLMATAYALPFANDALYPRDCEPGTLVCNGNAKFGICDLNRAAVWMAVAEGTECACSGSSCKIAAAGSAPGNPGSPPPPAATSAPATQPANPPPTIPDTEVPPTVAVPTTTAPAETPKMPIPTVPANEPSKPVSPPPPATTEQPAKPTGPVNNPVSGGSGGSSPGIAHGSTYMKTFLGNGQTSEGWPSLDQWQDFNSMWESNLKNVISQSCKGFGQENNSDQESADLKSAIESVAKSSGIDSRFILAIVMQESNGCVRAPTTNYGVQNPGLMQSHNGAHSCFNKSPCPSSEITGMIQDGTMGTSSGDGLKQILASLGGSPDATSYYKASRIYNSGSIAGSGLLQDGIATHCYVSDIANRLMGWSQGPGSCHI